MKSLLVPVLGIALVVAGILTPVVVALRQQEQQRNLAVVREGVLYRSAQLSVNGLKRVVMENGIRTIVSLREGVQAEDIAEEKWCNENAIAFVRIAPLSWGGVQGNAPIDTGLKRFLDVMNNRKLWPVLVHCYRGVHRTGGYVAVYRMEFEDWTPTQAINEMRDRGYVEIDWHNDIRHYLTTYRRTGRYDLHPAEQVAVSSHGSK